MRFQMTKPPNRQWDIEEMGENIEFIINNHCLMASVLVSILNSIWTSTPSFITAFFHNFEDIKKLQYFWDIYKVFRIMLQIVESAF